MMSDSYRVLRSDHTGVLMGALSLRQGRRGREGGRWRGREVGTYSQPPFYSEQTYEVIFFFLPGSGAQCSAGWMSRLYLVAPPGEPSSNKAGMTECSSDGSHKFRPNVFWILTNFLFRPFPLLSFLPLLFSPLFPPDSIFLWVTMLQIGPE